MWVAWIPGAVIVGVVLFAKWVNDSLEKDRQNRKSKK